MIAIEKVRSEPVGATAMQPDGLGFVSDGLIGDDPEAVKDGLRTSYRRLLSLDFDGVMCAHGDPMSSGAKKALREFVG